MQEEKEVKKESKFKRGCLGCLTWFSVVVGILLLLWFIFIERHFIFIRHEIQGRIIDNETKKPIENALVVFAWRSSGSGWREYDATITDKNGYYKLPKRFVLSYAKEGNIEFIGPPFIEMRDGCVLVAWFPGYFRSEKWESGKALIKGKQDFALQKAKTIGDIEISPSFISWEGIYYWGNKKNSNVKFYNIRNIDLFKVYRHHIEEFYK
jgi:hypothetical protein